MSAGAVANPENTLYKLSEGCPVWNGKGFDKYTIYATESAKKHSGGRDRETLRKELQSALNADAKQQIAQGGGVVKVMINNGLGYIVYKLNDPGPKMAKIFHYHWNYKLDNPA